MAQPAITGVPLTCKFGSLALPNGQGTMTQVNLNDTTKWFWQDFQGDDDYLSLTVGQLAWRGKATLLGQDRGARVLSLPMRFVETAAGDFGAAKAVLTEAGQQQLTFDNSTAILASLRAIRGTVLVKRYSPFAWDCSLEFLCPEPYFRNVASTTYMNAVALNSGSATNTNVTYAGSIFTEPVFTLHIPVTNPATTASFVLQNMMSGDSLTITFPGNLAASTLYDITIDCANKSVTSQLGVAYDVTGTFPLFYPPAGTVQQIRATLTPASGTETGCTLTAVATDRWLI
jgi:hypothetical protein